MFISAHICKKLMKFDHRIKHKWKRLHHKWHVLGTATNLDDL